MSDFKLCLLGEGCVGKTSLLLQYAEGKFTDKHHATLQASFLVKRINLSGRRVNLSIWDTAGQERFHALGPIYYRGSQGALLVYDITDRDSFDRVKNWVKELKAMLTGSVVLCIVGNKIDLERERNVSVEEAESYAQSVGARHYHTSAKHNKGLDELFLDAARRMLEVEDTNLALGGSSRAAGGGAGLLMTDEASDGVGGGGYSRGGCC